MADHVLVVVVEAGGDPLRICAVGVVASAASHVAVGQRIADTARRGAGCLHDLHSRCAGVEEAGPRELFADPLDDVQADGRFPGAYCLGEELDRYAGSVAGVRRAGLYARIGEYARGTWPHCCES